MVRVRVRVRFGSSDNIMIYPNAIVAGACVGYSVEGLSKQSVSSVELKHLL